MKKRIKIAQRILQKKGYYKGKIDGLMGPKTKAALHCYDGVNTT